MHDDVAVEPACELRRHELAEVALRRPACEAGGNEERLIAGRDAEALELGDNGRDRVLTRVVRRARDRQRRWLDDDRGAGTAAGERFEAFSLEREAQRVAHRCCDVGYGLPGRRRPQQNRALRRGGEDEPRAGEERDAGSGHRRRTIAWGL